MRSVALTGLLLLSCATGTSQPKSSAELEQLAAWMTGTFSSAEQSKADPENFYPIRLVMVPIWTDRSDGPWLYVEQATHAKTERPYRQRVYHLVAEPGGGIRSDVYTLPGNPLDHAGRWSLPGVTPEQLELREGCSIYLHRTPDGRFEGATRGKTCASTLGDAAYATSEVSIERNLLVSWDRGWNAKDEQAWGATKGGYRFVRTASAASASRPRR